ncbi:hypothetical protein INT48_008905 [Thamnidium elegans]|uniref:Uncharacterized protein n=1 Tax=Thamnidium elegans TaxID=101142 RepID=A0A8H7VUW3_9FUNG|nr:hypothetical protein INT48_008905 [Thamnidium elegans]
MPNGSKTPNAAVYFDGSANVLPSSAEKRLWGDEQEVRKFEREAEVNKDEDFLVQNIMDNNFKATSNNNRQLNKRYADNGVFSMGCARHSIPERLYNISGGEGLNFKDFLLENFSKDSIDITHFYDRIGVRFEDRQTIERSIKNNVNCILEEDSEYTVTLREICLFISVGDFLLLRNEPCENYWRQKQLREVLKHSENEKIDDELQQRRSKRLKKIKEFPTEQDKVLPGFNCSTASIIKLKAHNTFMGKKFSELNTLEKITVSNGFNSILDLTDNNDDSVSQKTLFTKEQWEELNNLYNKKIKWNPIDSEIAQELQEIEKVNYY